LYILIPKNHLLLKTDALAEPTVPAPPFENRCSSLLCNPVSNRRFAMDGSEEPVGFKVRL